MCGGTSSSEAEQQLSTPQANEQELDVNDHYAHILHEDRMTEYRADAHASYRVAEARRRMVKRRSRMLGVAAFAVTLTSLALSGVLVLSPAA
jgi:hypothetical protein